MRLTCEKRHPLTREEPTDPAGNPDPPDHWDLVPELIVQAPTLIPRTDPHRNHPTTVVFPNGQRRQRGQRRGCQRANSA